MELHDLQPAKGSKKSRKRIGRGPGSGTGKTAGRGHKGQKSRAGFSQRPGFEGGQMPLVRRVPKRGFTNIFKRDYAIVNVAQLDDFEGDVTPESLQEAGLVRSGMPLKVLGHGELTKSLTVRAHKFSKTARAKIEEAGGHCEDLDS